MDAATNHPRIIQTGHGRDVEHALVCERCEGDGRGSGLGEDTDEGRCGLCLGSGEINCDDCEGCSALLCQLGAQCGCGSCGHCLILQSHQMGPIVQRVHQLRAEGRAEMAKLLVFVERRIADAEAA